MPTINQLSAVDQINDGDQFPLYSPNAGDARKASFTTVKKSLADDFASLADLAAQTGAGLVGTSNGTTVQQALDSKPTATLDTDGTLAANSDGRVASQKATKTYADTKVAATTLAASGGAALVGKSGGGTVQDNLNHQKINVSAGNLIYGSTDSGSLLNNNVAGTKNGDISTAFGLNTLSFATSAYALSAFGYGALYRVSTGHSNTGLGYQAGHNLTTGIMNTLVGVDAMYLSTAGNYNTVLGHHCLNSGIFTGEGAVVIGQQTARPLTTGDYIIAIGRNAMANSPGTGSQNGVVIGGAAAISAAVDSSIVIGKDAVAVAGTITNSVIVGNFGQYGGGTVSATVQIGAESMFRATGGGGNNNATLGYQTGYSIAGTGNVLVGYRAGYRGSNTTVNSAVCIGNLAGFNAVTSGDLYIGNSDAISAHLIWGNFGTQVLNLRSNSLRFVDLPTFADDAAAGAGGLVAGTVYKTATGELRIKI